MEYLTFWDKANKIAAAYEVMMKPLLKEYDLPLPAFNILMTLAENEEIYTAKHISEYKGIKPNLISFYVDKLVNGGMLERREVEGDRRSVRLVVTETAKPVVERGRAAVEQYLALMWRGVSEEEHQICKRTSDALIENAEAIISGSCGGEKL